VHFDNNARRSFDRCRGDHDPLWGNAPKYSAADVRHALSAADIQMAATIDDRSGVIEEHSGT
jgi:hypothetical protein